jgi:CheY-like chemotaxis protein
LSDVLALIFDRFHQLDDSPGRRHEGTGLGLTIAQEIANLAGGELGVESEQGAGSRFWVRLPHTAAKPGAVAAHAQPSSSADVEAPVQAGARTALIVENNTINRNLLADFLEGAGWSVLQAVSAEHALEVLDLTEEDPDVVLLDLHMPGLSGEDLLAMLNNAYPQSPVVIVTADATSGTSQRLRAKGVKDYFVKPVNLEALSETLNRITAQGETGAS